MKSKFRTANCILILLAIYGISKSEGKTEFSYVNQLSNLKLQYENFSNLDESSKESKLLFLTALAQQFKALLILPKDLEGLRSIFDEKKFISNRDMSNYRNSCDKKIRLILQEIIDPFGDIIYVFDQKEKNDLITGIFIEILHL